VVASYERGGEEEAALIEGGERRRRSSGIRSHAEEVVRGTWRHAMLGRWELEVGDKAGGPDRAGLGRASRVATRPKGFFGLKMRQKGKRVA
jgi:hypothetical protein